MPSLRSLMQIGVTAISLALIGAGLYLSVGPVGDSAVLERPGKAVRLQSGTSSATAFFEVYGDVVELTMLFAEPEDPNSILRSRVRLMDGQSHSIVLGEADSSRGSHRYTFRRVGYTVEMHLAPVKTINASFIIPE